MILFDLTLLSAIIFDDSEKLLIPFGESIA